ncbi:MAG: prenyltransferase/squalene oxidase repeat-containing protein [Planctomycetota bacterium]|jgi:hypothetical protein
MTRYLLLLLLGLGLLRAPLLIQTAFADDEESEIEIGEDPKEEDEPTEDDEETTRKKNAGLAGGGKRDDGDPGAPKVKMSLQQQINAAIKKGVAYLKSVQNKDGSWNPVYANREYGTGKDIGKSYRDEMGPTLFAMYTLAKCGVKKTDPVMKKAMKYVMKETEYLWDELGGSTTKDQARARSKNLQKSTRKTPRVMSTYEVASMILMIEAVYQGSAKLTGKHKKRRLYSDNVLKPPPGGKIPKKTWRYMHNRIRFLTKGLRTGGKKAKTIPGLQAKGSQGNGGGWRYGPGNDADVSATQFALLALRAASQAGYPVERLSPNIYKRAAEYVKRCQKSNGGFGYQISGGKVTGSLTACGVGCLLICKEQMLLAKQTPPSWMDDSIKRGMKWLDKNFIAHQNPGGGKHHFYYLYGVERVGDLTGRKEFNGKDWYVRGARHLVAHQDENGRWIDPTEAFPPKDVNSTTLALLFLKRATPPTVTFSDG